MEEAWELAAVSVDLNDEPFKSYITDNEFALRYHLKQIETAIRDFDIAYRRLLSISEVHEKEDIDPDEVWGAINYIANTVSIVVQTIKPTLFGKRSAEAKEYSKVRGKILCFLLEVDSTDANKLKEIRNRIEHNDEDFDDWFVHEADREDDRMPLRLIRKPIFFDEVQLHKANQGVLLGYDIKSGVFHNLGERFDIHWLCRSMRLIRDQLSEAFLKLTEISGKETSLTLVPA